MYFSDQENKLVVFLLSGLTETFLEVYVLLGKWLGRRRKEHPSFIFRKKIQFPESACYISN